MFTETAFGSRRNLRSDGHSLLSWQQPLGFHLPGGARSGHRQSRDDAPRAGSGWRSSLICPSPEAIGFPTAGPSPPTPSTTARSTATTWRGLASVLPWLWPTTAGPRGPPPGAGPSTQFWTTADSPWSTSTTAAARATGGPTASGSTASGAWSIWPTSPMPRAISWIATNGRPAHRHPWRHRRWLHRPQCPVFSELFAACAAHFGISDLETRAKETYKFEAHKADILVGPYPETRGRFRARSPIHFVDQASCYVMIQGLEDRIRPSSQAETMVAALRQGRAGRRCPIRGRPPRLPAYREYPVRTRRGVVLLRAQLRISTCRPRRAGHHREPLTLDRRRM